ncbi:MAG: hypothetical protein M1829_002347 [Trizodia sp. TS-e1964]|nr:MAG: hypothetical protein M1829_002347 [Trizodia sp. TS-e1964]
MQLPQLFVLAAGALAFCSNASPTPQPAGEIEAIALAKRMFGLSKSQKESLTPEDFIYEAADDRAISEKFHDDLVEVLDDPKSARNNYVLFACKEDSKRSYIIADKRNNAQDANSLLVEEILSKSVKVPAPTTLGDVISRTSFNLFRIGTFDDFNQFETILQKAYDEAKGRTDDEWFGQVMVQINQAQRFNWVAIGGRNLAGS